MATDFLVKQGKVMGGVRLVTDADVAHQTDLTNIRETGTTSSQAISYGTYFYLNDVLVRARVDIANGATFTLNTNYEVVTAGALNTSRYYDYAHTSARIDFISTKTHTATQNCLFSFYLIGQGALNATISINNQTVLDALYMAGYSSSQYVSYPMTYPMKQGDVLSITVNSGTISELRGREIPFA